MDKEKIIAEFKREFPACRIECTPQNGTTEIICEIERTTSPDQSTAIAVIDKSAIHYHADRTEVYIVEEGTLTVHLNTETVRLKKGNVLIIQRGDVHWAQGKATRVRVITRPAWNSDDHHLVKKSSRPSWRKAPLVSHSSEQRMENVAAAT